MYIICYLNFFFFVKNCSSTKFGDDAIKLPILSIYGDGGLVKTWGMKNTKADTCFISHVFLEEDK